MEILTIVVGGVAFVNLQNFVHKFTCQAGMWSVCLGYVGEQLFNFQGKIKFVGQDSGPDGALEGTVG